MVKYSIKEVFNRSKYLLTKEILINGWVKAFRSYRFISLNDGSTIKNLQIVIEKKLFSYEFLKKIKIGIALGIKGVLIKSLGREQTLELFAKEIKIYCEFTKKELNETLLQPKRHNIEKLREKAHLRFKTRIFSSIIRVRHCIAFAIHEYFNSRGFFYLHTPIITSSDAEGAGNVFSVTSLNLENLPLDNKGNLDQSKDFFGCATNLTVSGQLEGEAAAMALGKIYTFGPTFRAEKSNTPRHLSEFWMIEPEIAFYELLDVMNLAEDFLKNIIKSFPRNCKDDLHFINERFIAHKKQKNEFLVNNIFERLELIEKHPFIRISYTEAISILLYSQKHNLVEFKYDVKWGMDLQAEHERYLVDEHFRAPVIIFDFPANVKAFYMRLNNDGETVSAMDVVLPSIGEIIGGSQREERLDILIKRIKKFGLNEKYISWYLDTRRFGSAPHSGFGLGFDRFVQYITGMNNIRDVIPYPRTPKNAKF